MMLNKAEKLSLAPFSCLAASFYFSSLFCLRGGEKREKERVREEMEKAFLVAVLGGSLVVIAVSDSRGLSMPVLLERFTYAAEGPSKCGLGYIGTETIALHRREKKKNAFPSPFFIFFFSFDS